MAKIYEVPAHLYAQEALGRSKDVLKALQAGFTENVHPEHVTQAVSARKARVFVVADDDKELLCMVMQPNGEHLHIWVAYGLINDEVLEAAEQIAKQLGFKGLTFDSRRKGWQRRAMQLGFSPQRWIKEF